MGVHSSPSTPPPVKRGCSPRRTYGRDRAANNKETISPNFKNCVLRTASVIKSKWKSHPSRTVDTMHDGIAVTTLGVLDDRWYTTWRRKRLKCLHPLYKALFILCICYQFHVVFASCRKEGGRTVLREAEGTISDGNANYPEDTECQWLIEASDAQMSICLHFTVFKTECTYDFLHIFDGDSFSSPLIGSFSGNKLPPTLCASSGKAQPKCDCVDGYIGENCSLSTIDNTGWGSSFVLSSGGDAGLTPRTGHGAVYHSEDDTMWVFGGELCVCQFLLEIAVQVYLYVTLGLAVLHRCTWVTRQSNGLSA
ncbi:Multiple epidermal growth factor-like domains protein 8 [Holothuria leucospilota]|uniref:Multiple epidermal growth factor-like domains protein 8 n=1 Tax=Holothuria leucospilota TaxID=206669 RepID=A0A9Q1BAM5_HOLLE|nr:Multiple epidermal growth factor-like domains protein 8 [Holothuria leucospilota]